MPSSPPASSPSPSPPAVVTVPNVGSESVPPPAIVSGPSAAGPATVPASRSTARSTSTPTPTPHATATRVSGAADPHLPTPSPSLVPPGPLPTRTEFSSVGRSSDAAEPSSAGIYAEDIEMDPITPAGHRRRRSSLMNPASSATPGRSRGAPVGYLQDEPKISEESQDTVKTRPSQARAEDGSFDEDLHDDEETGLTDRERRRKQKKKRRNTLLDQRIVRDNLTSEEKKEADQDVIKKLVLNGTLILLWYLFSLCISLYNKWMFDSNQLNFPFPLFITSVHMLVQFVLATAVLYFVPSLRPRRPDLGGQEAKAPIMTKLFYLTRIGPCGAATGLDIGLGNTSLKFITLTFYTMCKSSSLAFVLMFAFLFRLEKATWKLVAIIAVMTMGVVMMVAGEVEFKLGGFILVISAAFFSGFRWGLTQILLLRHPATSNPFSSIFFLAPVMFLTLACIAIPSEGFWALMDGLKALTAEWGLLAPLLILFPGTIAFLMTASEFALLQRTSVVTLSIAGIFKEVVTISTATLVFDDKLTPINISGLLVTLGAICAYNYIKIAKMRHEAQTDVRRRDMAGELSSPSNSDTDVEDDGEEAGLLARRSAELDDNLVIADGDIVPRPQPSPAPGSTDSGADESRQPQHKLDRQD